jgi:hypothetical protein
VTRLLRPGRLRDDADEVITTEGDGCAMLVGDLIELLAEHVGFHAEGNQLDLRSEVFGNPRRGVKGVTELRVGSELVAA